MHIHWTSLLEWWGYSIIGILIAHYILRRLDEYLEKKLQSKYKEVQTLKHRNTALQQMQVYNRRDNDYTSFEGQLEEMLDATQISHE